MASQDMYLYVDQGKQLARFCMYVWSYVHDMIWIMNECML